MVQFPTSISNLVYRDLDRLFIPQDIILVYYIIDYITLTTPVKKEETIVLDTSLKHIYDRW